MRGKNVNADIDSTLFGSGEKQKRIASSRSDGQQGLNKPSAIGDFFSGGGSAGTGGRSANRKSARLVTRPAAVKKQMAPGQVLLSFAEYSRIRQNSIPMADVLAAERAERNRRRQSDMDVSSKNKAEMDKLRQDTEANMAEINAEQAEKEDEILRNARAAMEDSEEEVRMLRSKIMQAKCMAIRDKQLEERRAMEQALKDEERGLEELMEQMRVDAIEAEAQKEVELKQAYVEGRKELEVQISEREQDRLLREELKEQEAVERALAYEKMLEEDLLAKQKKAEESRRAMAEATKINETAIKMREIAAEGDRKEEMARLEFMKAKIAAEEAEEQRKIDEKRAKDLVFAETLRQQEKALDMRGARDELMAKRAQFEKERKIREEEAAKAEAKKRSLEELHHAREAQIRVQIEQKVRQAVADQSDFERTLAAQKELIEKSKVTEEELVKKARANREGVLAQISERERNIRAEREEFFKEGITIDEEAKIRRARIDAIKRRMLEEVEAEGVEPNYLYNVKRDVVKA